MRHGAKARILAAAPEIPAVAFDSPRMCADSSPPPGVTIQQ